MYGRETHELWTAEVPLICFNLVEWHHPSRIMCQSGYKQQFPPDPIGMKDAKHHMQRKSRKDWAIEMREHIEMWNIREELVITGKIDNDHDNYILEYHTCLK